MSMLTREQILARKTSRDTATLPDGSLVAVRGLTRDEVLHLNSLDDHAERDTYLVATGVIDPVLSLDDVRAWASAADAGDLVAVSERIAQLSGLVQGAPKSGVPGV